MMHSTQPDPDCNVWCTPHSRIRNIFHGSGSQIWTYITFLTPPPSHLISHPSPLTPHLSPLPPHTSFLTPPPSPHLPHTSSFTPPPSSLTIHPSASGSVSSVPDPPHYFTGIYSKYSAICWGMFCHFDSVHLDSHFTDCYYLQCILLSLLAHFPIADDLIW